MCRARCRTRRRRVHPARRDHGDAARARRLSVGPRADDRHAEAVRARGDLRGARGDRPARSRRAVRGARRLRVRGGVPRADRSRGGPLHDRRLAASASPTSWCGATRTCSRATTGEPALDSAGQVRTRWEEIKAQERGGTSDRTPKTLLSGIRAGAAGAAARVPHRRARRVGRLRLVARRRCGREDPGGGRRAARGRRRRPAGRSRARAEEEMGDLLFAIANCRGKLGIEPETALRKANDKFTRRFTTMERAISESGRTHARHDARGTGK